MNTTFNIFKPTMRGVEARRGKEGRVEKGIQQFAINFFLSSLL